MLLRFVSLPKVPWWVVAVAAALVTSQVRAQRALPEELELSWQAPAGCPQQADLRAELMRTLPVRKDWPDLEVEGRIVPVEPSGFRLELRFDGDREGARSLSADSCDGLARAAAVLIELVMQPPAEPPPPPPPMPEVEEPASPADDERAAATSPALAMAFAVEPALVLDVGTMPAPTAAIGAAVRLVPSPLEVGLEAALYPGTREPLSGDAQARVEFDAWEVALVGCWLSSTQTVAFGPCVGPSLLVLSGASRGVLDEDDAQQLTVELQAGGAARLRLASWLGLRLDVRAAVPLRRSVWSVGGFGYSHEPAPVAGRFAFGVEVIR